MKRSWSVYNSGSGFSNANTGPGAQYNNNAAGSQYNNYYIDPTAPCSGTDQERERLKREKQECLQSLSFTDIDTRRQNIDQVHPNTGDWIFKTTEFLQWCDRTMLPGHNGVLWIKGHPGTGKSTLMKHIWRHFQDTGHTIATYFFNARSFSLLEKTALGMIRSLLCQLLVEEESTYQHFLPVFRRKKQMHNKWEWGEAELKEFLLSEMQIYQGKPLVLLVDALDECSDLQVQNVVDFLKALSISEVNVSICLSSRHYPHIISMGVFQELVVEKKAGHNTDIAMYVHDKLAMADSRIARIEEGVLNKASGIFMWVVLVVAMLKKAYANGKVGAMEQKLREVPSDLDELFSTILSKENPDKQETILMLQWVLFAVRPLEPEELYYATLAGTGVTNLGPWDQSQLTADDIQRCITYSSKGLIEVPKAESTVQFIHESVKDFLLRNQRLQSLDPTLGLNPIGQSHDRLKTCCLSFIETNASILDDISMDGDSSKRDEFHLKYPFLKYASLHWLDHAEAAEAGNVSQTGFMKGIKEDPGVERLSWFHTCFCNGKESFAKCIIGYDLLCTSLAHQHNRVARILLEHGTDISPQGWNYGLALHAAVSNGPKEMSEMEGSTVPRYRLLWLLHTTTLSETGLET
ncbi:hypothetical protein B0H65DRAFT_479220 [Neurospora tetraspora]|uniref:Nephrocystin 3-like N-terminal domain-containing protein n=1 Tax=Neurospora tetraspora TaxID=94610 RepID=A0AAE0J7W2_9PEZI|nr:hypothetical protein B0H65DRAFT_479220 [Neurospora tetraspora]